MDIRPYERARDYGELTRIFSSGFHHVAWPILDGVASEFAADLIEGMASLGNFAWVAESGGKAQGILLGSSPTVSPTALVRGWPARLRLFSRLLLGRYDLPPVARRYLLQAARGFGIGMISHHPAATSEVMLFVVDDSVRGKGLGAKLMRRFFEHARDTGAPSVQLMTHSVLSWQFYERMKFERIRTWREIAFSVAMPGEPIEAYIYEYPLAAATKQAAL